jgi:hypothetical protein
MVRRAQPRQHSGVLPAEIEGGRMRHAPGGVGNLRRGGRREAGFQQSHNAIDSIDHFQRMFEDIPIMQPALHQPATGDERRHQHGERTQIVQQAHRARAIARRQHGREFCQPAFGRGVVQQRCNLARGGNRRFVDHAVQRYSEARRPQQPHRILPERRRAGHAQPCWPTGIALSQICQPAGRINDRRAQRRRVARRQGAEVRRRGGHGQRVDGEVAGAQILLDRRHLQRSEVKDPPTEGDTRHARLSIQHAEAAAQVARHPPRQRRAVARNQQVDVADPPAQQGIA